MCVSVRDICEFFTQSSWFLLKSSRFLHSCHSVVSQLSLCSLSAVSLILGQTFRAQNSYFFWDSLYIVTLLSHSKISKWNTPWLPILLRFWIGTKFLTLLLLFVIFYIVVYKKKVYERRHHTPHHHSKSKSQKSESMKEYSTPSCFKQEGPQYSSLGGNLSRFKEAWRGCSRAREGGLRSYRWR